ncbi:hypothetical protein Tco_1237689 [Tanacetum coccineum]
MSQSAIGQETQLYPQRYNVRDESKCHRPRDETIPRRPQLNEMIQVPSAKRRNYTSKAQATRDESKCHRPRDAIHQAVRPPVLSMGSDYGCRVWETIGIVSCGGLSHDVFHPMDMKSKW